MGRQAVVQVSCDRCKRVEHRPFSEGAEPAKGKAHFMFSGIYKGKRVEFEDLCTGCEAILDNHWEGMARQLKKKSPIRGSRP